MGWPLVLLDKDAWLRHRLARTLTIGHCCYAPWVLDLRDWRCRSLGARYLAMPTPRRSPIVIELPGHNLWCPDVMAWDAGRGDHGEGWAVHGELEHLAEFSITPSINCAGSYHGWVTKGVITDDCEGRTYPSGN